MVKRPDPSFSSKTSEQLTISRCNNLKKKDCHLFNKHHEHLKTKTSQLKLYREITALCSQIHTQHKHKVKSVSVKPARTCSNHVALNALDVSAMEANLLLLLRATCPFTTFLDFKTLTN